MIEALPDYIRRSNIRERPGTSRSRREQVQRLFVKTTIKGAPAGKLSGKTVAFEDNVGLAGLPMINGTSILDCYTPDVDATIVTRLWTQEPPSSAKLTASTTVLGRLATGALVGPQPRNGLLGRWFILRQAAFGPGEVDLSIVVTGRIHRMPASYCGVVGMKPNWGLVPYYGVMPMN